MFTKHPQVDGNSIGIFQKMAPISAQSAILKGYMHELPILTFWATLWAIFTTAVLFPILNGKKWPENRPIKWPKIDQSLLN